MNIESFFADTVETNMNGLLTLFNWKTKEMFLVNGEMLVFKTNNEACQYCHDNKLSGIFVDQINPKLRSNLFK